MLLLKMPNLIKLKRDKREQFNMVRYDSIKVRFKVRSGAGEAF